MAPPALRRLQAACAAALLLLLPPAAAQPALHELVCQCNATTGVHLHRAGPPLHVILPTSPAGAGLASIVNPRLNRNVTFACACAASPPGPPSGGRQYILSARQTDALSQPPSACIGTELMASVCDKLRVLRLFDCESQWRSGFAGRSADGLASNGALVEAVKLLCVAGGGPCARTIEFDDLLDEVIASADY